MLAQSGARVYPLRSDPFVPDLMMNRLRQALDPFLLMLIATVALASILPARGQGARIAEGMADAGIVLLFFLHGAKLSRAAIWQGARAWKLHAATLATTFLIFPLLGWLLGRFGPVPEAMRPGLLFLTLLPSTVQSSIAFTAIARGNVAAAVVSASFSNLLGIVVTPLLVALLMQRTGNVSTANNGGFIQIRTTFSFVDLINSDKDLLGVRLNTKGNGETYHIFIRTSEDRSYRDFYSATFTANENWEIVDLPFTKFKHRYSNKSLDGNDIRTFGIVAYGRDFFSDVSVSEISFYD